MTKIKLSDGTIINAESVELVNGALKVTTAEKTVEELAEIFSDKTKTSLITLMTESEKETGYKTGFTSFAGINYGADGVKTVELFQPADVTELRISGAEGMAKQAIAEANEATETVNAVEERVSVVEEGQELQDGAIVELAEIIGGE